MLRLSLGLTEEADAVERAVRTVLEHGARTADIACAGDNVIGCREMAQKIAAAI